MPYKFRIFSPKDLSYPFNGENDFEHEFESTAMHVAVEEAFKIMKADGYYTNQPYHASLRGEVINTEKEGYFRYHFHSDGWCDFFIETDCPYNLTEKDMRIKVFKNAIRTIKSELEVLENEFDWIENS